MKKILFFVLLLASSHWGLAQKFSIKGQVKDSTMVELPSATIMLIQSRDSTMVNFAITDKNGYFEVKNVNPGNYLLRVSFIGYANQFLRVGEPQNGEVQLGVIKMGQEDQLLSGVVIEGERIPMIIKKDTIEYDALAFKVRENAVVEDLLKRLPGIEVDNEGTITAQGEQVRRVLVDGKEFFGRDPKMATQNLPADAVSKVQVFDRKSEQAQFSGIDDGQREKTINLELKDDKKAGAFGNTSAGYGSDDRFALKTNVNRFSKKGQLSFLGQGNNINQQGFSFGEFMNFSGNSQRMLGGGAMTFNRGGGSNSMVPINFGGRAGTTGITETWAGGVNANQKVTDKTEVNGSYFYNYMNTNVETDLERENFLPSGNFDFLQNSQRNTQNESHRSNVRIDSKLDTANSLLITADASLSNTRSFQNTESSNTRADGFLQNDSEQETFNQGKSANVNTNLLWRHRFTKKGRTLSAGLDFAANQSENEGYLQAVNRFYAGDFREIILNQENEQNTSNQTIGTNFNFTEPLGNRRYLEVNYVLAQNRNQVNQDVYDLEEGARVFNTLLSNRFKSNYLYQRGGLNLRINRDSYNFTLGSGMQLTRLKGASEIQDFTIDNQFLNFLPLARFNYEFSTSKRLSMDYETSVQEPGIQELQPLVDNRDPLNIYVGNPNLRPAYRQSLQARYNNFNIVNSVGFFLFGTAEYISNAIVYAQLIDENLVRTTTPVNVSNNINFRGSANMTFPIKKLSSRVNLGTNINQRRGVNLLNDVEETIVNNSLGGNLRYVFTYKEVVETFLTANWNHQLTRYEFTDLNQVFLNQTYGAEFNLNFLKKYRFSTNYSYLIFQGQQNDFNQAIPLLDLSIARSFLKNNSLEGKLSASNLLDQNIGISQRADVNFVERSVTNALGRYFMVTLTYSLNKQLNPMSGTGRGRGQGPRMMMQQ
ncbi:MAG: TonB-dependent receptor [Cyclobacteriaceae bacterium]|nr:TonB-dependent receptor [Cyclobacteriaceae bacterium]